MTASTEAVGGRVDAFTGIHKFIEHYHQARPHQGLGQRRPCEPADEISVTTGPVERRDRLGGLLHEYRRAA